MVRFIALLKGRGASMGPRLFSRGRDRVGDVVGHGAMKLQWGLGFLAEEGTARR